MGVNEGTLTHVKDVLERWRGDETDSRLVSDTARIMGDGRVYIEQEIVAIYDALLWAKDNWLYECGVCGGLHFTTDINVGCPQRYRS